MAISEALLLSLRRITDREASAESPAAPRKCSAPSAAGDLPGYGVSRSARAGGWWGQEGGPPGPWRGCPTPVRPPPRRVGCLCFSRARLPAAPAPAPGSAAAGKQAARRAGPRRRRRLRGCSRPSVRPAPGPGPARPRRAAGRPRPARGTPSSAKEPLPNADVIQNKNFYLFFLFCFSECEQQGM